MGNMILVLLKGKVNFFFFFFFFFLFLYQDCVSQSWLIGLTLDMVFNNHHCFE